LHLVLPVIFLKLSVWSGFREMFLVRLHVDVMGKICFTGGMETVEFQEGQMGAGKNSLRREADS